LEWKPQASAVSTTDRRYSKFGGRSALRVPMWPPSPSMSMNQSNRGAGLRTLFTAESLPLSSSTIHRRCSISSEPSSGKVCFSTSSNRGLLWSGTLNTIRPDVRSGGYTCMLEKSKSSVTRTKPSALHTSAMTLSGSPTSLWSRTLTASYPASLRRTANSCGRFSSILNPGAWLTSSSSQPSPGRVRLRRRLRHGCHRAPGLGSCQVSLPLEPKQRGCRGSRTP
jgi:hypothetical protein